MYKIRTYNNIASKGLKRFSDAGFGVSADCPDPDAIILRSQDLHREVVAESVLAVARAGAGINNIPVADYARRGIVAFNTPGANDNAVKELVVAALLLASRDIFGGLSFTQSLAGDGDAEQLSRLLEKEKKRFAGSEIYAKTLGVVGLGSIGSLVANMALDLEMEVVGFDPAISVEAAWRVRLRLLQQIEKSPRGQNQARLATQESTHGAGATARRDLRGLRTR